MGFWILVLIAVLIYFATRDSAKKSGVNLSPGAQLDKRNEEWASFIAGYALVAKTKSEKQLLAKMLSDIRTQNLVDDSFVANLLIGLGPEQVVATQNAEVRVEDSVVEATGESVIENTEPVKKDSLAIKLDNISLLLYFGAFLLVASAGLFVGFADVSGNLRTLTVLLVSIALYATGIWIYNNRQALKPAGLAFAGIGMSIAPLVGVAAYKYVFPDNGPVVWMVTSLMCALYYVHALVVLRKPLINYILIFTLLSLFESGVAVVDFPIYYFGWAMAFVGIALQAVGAWKNIWPDLRESSRNSSQVFLPLALLASLSLTISHGVGQFGFSLLLAACFYGLEAYRSSDTTQESNAVVSHISLLAGLGCVVYWMTGDALTTGMMLVALTIAQTALLMVFDKTTAIIYNFASVAMVSGVVGLFFIGQNYTALLAGISGISLVALAIWFKQKRTDAYVLGVIGWGSLPLIFGQLVTQPAMSAVSQSWVVLASLLVHLGLFIRVVIPKKDESLRDAARAMLIIHIIVAILVALFASPLACLGILVVISLLMLPLSVSDDSNFWSIISGAVVSMSLVSCFDDKTVFPIAIFVSLAYNILLSLRFRSEPNRWLSAILWLLIPVGIVIKNGWSAEHYAWLYVVVMVALIISRAIARGVVFTSTKIPISSYAKTASLSYVYGYVAAGVLAVIISLGSENSQLHTSLIIGLISIVCFVLAWGVEKRSEFTALQPFFWQLLLLSVIRPEFTVGMFEGYLLLSIVLSAFCYAVSSMFVSDKKYNKLVTNEFVQVSLLTTFIAPVSFVVFPNLVWAMPLGLMVAGVALFDYWNNKAQEYKEVACGIVVMSVLWFMFYFGIREVQAYSHVIAAVFGGFAYWRHTRNEQTESDNYLYCMLATATVPLVLQALSGEAGGLYGWWLLLEQVVFMMLGVAIRRKVVTMWGLYVAIGAVLYQLRNLGWAALTVLALFIIGVAVYQLQKYNKPDQ